MLSSFCKSLGSISSKNLVIDAGEEYQTYSAIADGQTGSVKFIYKLASIDANADSDMNDTVAKYLKSIGIKYGRTVESSHSFEIPKESIKLKATCHHDDEMLFELAEKFIKAEPKEDEQMLFYVWGHSYEFDVNNNWDRIEKFCKMMAGRDDIFYGTNRECLVD